MILIDEKMPKTCYDCPCNSDNYWCNLLIKEIDFEDSRMERMSDCPLLETNSSDDLISRQAAIDALNEVDDGASISTAITVIEGLPSAQPTQSNASNTLNALDTIYRHAAIKELLSLNDQCNSVYYTKCIDDAVYALEILPSAQPEPQWIPCSERLPDIRHNVLITDGYHTAEGQMQDNGDWVQYRWTCKRKHGEIIAWCELPECYKGEKHETK